MAITGAHVLLYSSRADELRALLRDVFEWKSVDAGGGWLIFALPPTEVAVHPAEGPTYEGGAQHQLTLMCDNIEKTVGDLQAKGIVFQGQISDQGWGLTIMMELPGTIPLMLYQPKHPIAFER